ncbi:hypothetical protein [Lacipirellula parvula]|nr:hypothetical protein [Lacipirellula parvula]
MLIVTSIFALSGCADDQVVGNWKSSASGVSVEFLSDGSGVGAQSGIDVTEGLRWNRLSDGRLRVETSSGGAKIYTVERSGRKLKLIDANGNHDEFDLQ